MIGQKTALQLPVIFRRAKMKLGVLNGSVSMETVNEQVDARTGKVPRVDCLR